MEQNSWFNHWGKERDIHLIDEIERSQALFKLAKAALLGVSVSSMSHNIQSYCNHKYMRSTVVLSLLLRLPLGVITKQGTNAHEIISFRGQSGTKNQVLNN